MEKWKIPLLIVLILAVVSLFIIVVRISGDKQIDAVNPYMYCMEKDLRKVDVFYVVPKYKGVPINDSRTWCDYILSFDKEIYMYGIEGTFEEFSWNISEDEINEAMGIFQSCFGYPPEKIKPPQLVVNEKNKEMFKDMGLNIDVFYNQLLHKVYHCGDFGLLPNKFQDYF